jgi:hypothetical protein
MRDTAHSFPASGSRLLNVRSGTQLRHGEMLAVKLPVAVGMEQHAVGNAVRPALSSPNQVVAVPAREFGDFLLTQRTDTVLLFPETGEHPPSPQGVAHLHPEAFLEVRFPGGIIRVRFFSDFNVPSDGGF